MPGYLYRCDANHEFLVQMGMHEEKPQELPCEYCQGVAKRVFTIPGMKVINEDEWIIKMPGEVKRERRDKKWRDSRGITARREREQSERRKRARDSQEGT